MSSDRLLLNWRVPVDRDLSAPVLEEIRELVLTLGKARALEVPELQAMNEAGAEVITVHVESGPAQATGEVVLVARPSECVTAALEALRAVVARDEGAGPQA